MDDLPPVTVITHVLDKKGQLLIRGTTSDNGSLSKVLVNGTDAKAIRPNFAEWEVTIDRPGSGRMQAHAVDAAGNTEKHGHVRRYQISP